MKRRASVCKNRDKTKQMLIFWLFFSFVNYFAQNQRSTVRLSDCLVNSTSSAAVDELLSRSSARANERRPLASSDASSWRRRMLSDAQFFANVLQWDADDVLSLLSELGVDDATLTQLHEQQQATPAALAVSGEKLLACDDVADFFPTLDARHLVALRHSVALLRRMVAHAERFRCALARRLPSPPQLTRHL